MQTEKVVVPFEIKELNEESDDFFTFKGFASTFGNIDLVDDVIEPGAFQESIREKEGNGERFPALWQHRMTEPIGVYSQIREDAKGLFVEGKLPKSDTFVSGRVIPQLKIGSVSKLSIGFSVFDDGSVEMVNGIRHIKKLKLFEVSLVTFPANPEASITEVKGAVPFQDLPLADRDRPWDSSAAKARVRTWAGAEEGLDTATIQRKYRRCFFWYDEGSPDVFASYKLPFTDIINGRLTAIPRGIFAAAAAMRGARGGVDIPSEDRPAVIRNINRYYDKMDLPSPFREESAFRIDDFKSHSERELEEILNTGACFSGKKAKVIISALKAAGLWDGESGGHRDGDLMGDLKTNLLQLKKELEEI